MGAKGWIATRRWGGAQLVFVLMHEDKLLTSEALDRKSLQRRHSGAGRHPEDIELIYRIPACAGMTKNGLL
jgi:hypothetical protein